MREDNPFERHGKAMLIISWILALALLTFFFRDALETRANPNRQPLSRTGTDFNEVVLRRNSQHHYVTGGLINNQPVVFMVDTGATHVALSARLARRLNLREGRPEIHNTANGLVETRATVIDELQIGSITLKKVRASISPGMTMDEVLLGMSALKNVEFTHRNGELTLRQLF